MKSGVMEQNALTRDGAAERVRRDKEPAICACAELSPAGTVLVAAAAQRAVEGLQVQDQLGGGEDHLKQLQIQCMSV